MVPRSRKCSLLVCALLAAGLSAWSSVSALAMPPHHWREFSSGLAIGGFDPVAYFTKGNPVRGKAEYEADWNGATWRFVNAGNLSAFMSDPQVYAPMFGGYGAYGLAEGRFAKGSPYLWRIHDGRLFLFFSARNLHLWQADRKGLILRAGLHWPKQPDTSGHIPATAPSANGD